MFKVMFGIWTMYIFLSIIWGLCSTSLVRIGFWKNVKNKTLNNVKIMKTYNHSVSDLIFIDLLCFCGTFLISLFYYIALDIGFNLDSIFIPATICLFLQFFKDFGCIHYYRKMLVAIAIYFALFLQEIYAFVNISLPQKNTVALQTIDINGQNFNIIPTIDGQEANDIGGCYYSNNKYIIYTKKSSSMGTGIVIMDSFDTSFIPCNYEFYTVNLRPKYPTPILKDLYIVLDGDTPYGVFATYQKTSLLGSYNINGYIVFNLLDGTSNFYSNESELPDFVTN